MFEIEKNLSRQQKEALEDMLAGENVFITGYAGTGKSTITKIFKQRCRKELVCLASTGRAALNIGGETVHSFFGFNSGVLNKNAPYRHWSSWQTELLRTTEVILVDEISMLRSDIFVAMDTALKQANDNDLPFGGKQIIVVGDFFQLPPVITDERIAVYLQEEFGGIYAFQTEEWQQAHFKKTYLKLPFRQWNDRQYFDAVNGIRTNELEYTKYEELCNDTYISQANYLDTFNSECYRPDTMLKNAVALCCKKYDAEVINNIAINQLPGQPTIFEASICGDFPADSYPASRVLWIKPGVKMMLLANSPGFYANGTIGTVVDCSSAEQWVSLQLPSQEIIRVTPNIWPYHIYEVKINQYGQKYITQTEVGNFMQLPLTPAYAITIHRAQGQTLDAVNLILGERGCFAPGQLYTALTRCRNFASLRLERPIMERDVLTDPDVKAFDLQLNPPREMLYNIFK